MALKEGDQFIYFPNIPDRGYNLYLIVEVLEEHFSYYKTLVLKNSSSARMQGYTWNIDKVLVSKNGRILTLADKILYIDN